VSAKKAEDFVASLRKCLGGFPVKPFSTERRPSEVMTEWLRTGEPPSNLTIESECELKSEEKEGSVIRCQRQELISPEMKLHLDAGKQVTKLALSFEDRLGFVLGDDWVIRKLRFLDLIQEEAAQVDEGSDEAQFDADFALMSREINRMIQSLVPLFGGASQ
jgi:recombination associated protein RdgC